MWVPGSQNDRDKKVSWRSWWVCTSLLSLQQQDHEKCKEHRHRRGVLLLSFYLLIHCSYRGEIIIAVKVTRPHNENPAHIFPPSSSSRLPSAFRPISPLTSRSYLFPCMRRCIFVFLYLRYLLFYLNVTVISSFLTDFPGDPIPHQTHFRPRPFPCSL